MDDQRPWLVLRQGPAEPRLSAGHAVRGGGRDRARVPDAIAWDFLDTTSTYRELVAAIDRCADALAALGLARRRAHPDLDADLAAGRDRVLRGEQARRGAGADPSAVDRAGDRALPRRQPARASRSRSTRSTTASPPSTPKPPLETLILARIPDYLSPLKRLGFWLTKGRKIRRGARRSARALVGRSDGRAAIRGAAPAAPATNDPAAILFSGGTTGLPKGIVLSNRNFIAEGMQAAAWGGMGEGAFDPRDPADLPRLRPGRVRERRVHGRRQVDPGAAVQRARSWRSCCAPSGPTCWWACPRCSTR